VAKSCRQRLTAVAVPPGEFPGWLRHLGNHIPTLRGVIEVTLPHLLGAA
jgi:hypothetical protein